MTLDAPCACPDCSVFFWLLVFCCRSRSDHRELPSQMRAMCLGDFVNI